MYKTALLIETNEPPVPEKQIVGKSITAALAEVKVHRRVKRQSAKERRHNANACTVHDLVGGSIQNMVSYWQNFGMLNDTNAMNICSIIANHCKFESIDDSETNANTFDDDE